MYHSGVKKILLTTVVGLLVGSTIIVAPRHREATSVDIPESQSVPTTQTSLQPSATTITTTQPTATTPDTTTTTQPAFGLDPNNTNSQYIVYDKIAVMDGAGVPATEQADADIAIARVSNWSYGNFVTLCKHGVGPSSATTGDIRSSQATFGPSVYTDAIVQLKWCIQWMGDNNLTWNQL